MNTTSRTFYFQSTCVNTYIGRLIYNFDLYRGNNQTSDSSNAKKGSRDGIGDTTRPKKTHGVKNKHGHDIRTKHRHTWPLKPRVVVCPKKLSRVTTPISRSPEYTPVASFSDHSNSGGDSSLPPTGAATGALVGTAASAAPGVVGAGVVGATTTSPARISTDSTADSFCKRRGGIHSPWAMWAMAMVMAIKGDRRASADQPADMEKEGSTQGLGLGIGRGWLFRRGTPVNTRLLNRTAKPWGAIINPVACQCVTSAHFPLSATCWGAKRNDNAPLSDHSRHGKGKGIATSLRKHEP